LTKCDGLIRKPRRRRDGADAVAQWWDKARSVSARSARDGRQRLDRGSPDRRKLTDRRVVLEDVARCDLEDPAAEFELALVEALRDEGKGSQVLELHEHVLFDRSHEPLGAVEVRVALGDDGPEALGLGEPLLDER